MKNKRVTIRDIAKETGFSIATVSRVINKTNSFYSSQTKSLIEDAVVRLGYQPNLIAKGLKENKTYNIALIVPQIDDYYAGIYNGMQQTASQEGYSIMILSSNYSEKQEQRNISHIIDRQYDGVIVVTGLLQQELNNDLMSVFPECSVVYVEGLEKQEDVCMIKVDVEEVCYNATKYLMDLGHEKIAYVSAPMRFDTLKSRFQGYVRAHKEKNLEISDNIIFFEEDLEITSFDISYWVMKRILLSEEFSAMLVMSDWAAFTALSVADEIDKKIPSDLSIIGFDNLPLTEYSVPALTTISQDSEVLGELAFEKILLMLEGKEVDDVSLDATLIMRDSVSAPKAKNVR